MSVFRRCPNNAVFTGYTCFVLNNLLKNSCCYLDNRKIVSTKMTNTSVVCKLLAVIIILG